MDHNKFPAAALAFGLSIAALTACGSGESANISQVAHEVVTVTPPPYTVTATPESEPIKVDSTPTDTPYPEDSNPPVGEPMPFYPDASEPPIGGDPMPVEPDPFMSPIGKPKKPFSDTPEVKARLQRSNGFAKCVLDNTVIFCMVTKPGVYTFEQKGSYIGAVLAKSPRTIFLNTSEIGGMASTLECTSSKYQVFYTTTPETPKNERQLADNIGNCGNL